MRHRCPGRAIRWRSTNWVYDLDGRLKHVPLEDGFPGLDRAAHGLPEAAWDGRRHCTFAYAIFPNTILVLSPDYTSMLTMYPEAADQTLFCHVMLTPHPPRDAKEDDHWRRSLELIEGGVFQAEDLFIAEQAQIGMACGANKTMIYGRFEASIRSFHESVDEWTGARSIAAAPIAPLPTPRVR